jgi:hypothetical protein
MRMAARDQPGKIMWTVASIAVIVAALYLAKGLCFKRRKSIGHSPNGPVPPGVDYNTWLGPAPERPFNPNRFHYNWHWNWDFGGGEIANNGIYFLDIARWGLGKTEHPKRAMCLGGRLGYEDDGNTPNTQIGVLDYGDVQIIQEIRGLPSGKYQNYVQSGNVFHCENGTLVLGGATLAAFAPNGEVLQKFSGAGEHFRNFADAVKARRVVVVDMQVRCMDDDDIASHFSAIPQYQKALPALKVPPIGRYRALE